MRGGYSQHSYQMKARMTRQDANRITDDAASAKPVKLSFGELDEIIAREAPFVHIFGLKTEEIGHGTATVRLPYDERFIRPGGSISGPAMMALADFAIWVAIMGAIGPVALAVTTNLSINFLRKPSNTDLICEVRLLKLGKRLAVADAGIRAEGDEDLCAHVTSTYSVPPDR